MLDNLGNRMKAYEAAAAQQLPPRMPMLIRIDGRAFHTYTQGFEKPWDTSIRDGLSRIGEALLREIPGAKLAYCQSDEITVLVTDYDSLGFEGWFKKSVQKMASVSASIATAAFNHHMGSRAGVGLATFDARCFVLPQQDVCNAFIWRQNDAERNSVLGYCQTIWKQNEIHGLKCVDLRKRLEAYGVPWERRATWEKRGWCVTRKVLTMTAMEWLRSNHSERLVGNVPVDLEQPVTRSVIEPDFEIPRFSQERGYIEQHVYLDKEAQ
jgi:tRNA(His) guanylyltransferase